METKLTANHQVKVHINHSEEQETILHQSSSSNYIQQIDYFAATFLAEQNKN
jgi:hypothetical protein